jgi:hypothetical protein
MRLIGTHFATVCLLSVGTALMTAQVLAQSAAPETATASPPEAEAPQGIDEVVVRGRRMSEVRAELRLEIGKFLEAVVRVPAGRGFARWQGRVCVGVHNLENSVAAQYLVDRISRLALDVGLTPGEPGCAPDVIVVFTTEGKELAAALVEKEPLAFRPWGGVAGMQLGLEALDEFVQSEKPVRWWHVSMPVDAQSGQPAVRMPGQRDYPTVKVAGPSFLHSGVVDAMQRAIIIVDGKKLTGTTWEQLGDYLAVVSLAQIDPAAEPAEFDSILNLFSNPAAYSGLTDWDRSYVRALYAFDQERITRLQDNSVISEMARRELEPGE